MPLARGRRLTVLEVSKEEFVLRQQAKVVGERRWMFSLLGWKFAGPARPLGRVPLRPVQQAVQRLRLIGLDHHGSVARLREALRPLQADAILSRDPRGVVRAAVRQLSNGRSAA